MFLWFWLLYKFISSVHDTWIMLSGCSVLGEKNKSFSHRQKPWRKCHLTLSQFILLSDAVNRTQPDMLCAWVGASDEKGAAVFCFVWLRFGLLSEWTSNTYKHRQTCGLWSPGYFASSGSPRKCWSSFVKSNILIRMKVYWSQAHKKAGFTHGRITHLI